MKSYLFAISLLVTSAYALPFPVPGDINSDGTRDAQDLDIAAAHIAAVHTSPAVRLRADANLDGVVDAADFAWLAINGGAVPTPVPTPAQNALVSTRVVSGNPALPNANFVVEVAVSQNTTAQTPAAANFRVHFPPDAVTFVSHAGGELGATFGSNADIVNATPGLPERYRRIATLSNVSNTKNTPIAFTVTFRTAPSSPGPFDILVVDDQTSNALIDKSLGGIPHSFDNESTLLINSAPGGDPSR